MPFDCDSVTGKMTRSLSSCSGLKVDLDFVADRSGRPMLDPGTGSEPGRRIDGNAAVGRDGAGAKRQRRYMPFADGTEAENEAQAAFRVPDWSGCGTMLGLNSADASNEYSFRK